MSYDDDDDVYGDYEAGEKPTFYDHAEGGRITLSGGSVISVKRLEDIQHRVLCVLPHVDTADVLIVADFFLAEDWEAKSNHARRLSGMGLAFLVETGAVPLAHINPKQSGIRKYRVDLGSKSAQLLKKGNDSDSP